MIELVRENMGMNNMLAPEASYIGRRVLVERVDEETTVIPGVVSGVNKRKGKILVTSLIKPKVEFAAPLQLVVAGVAASRNGRLRYELMPEPDNLMRDPDQTFMLGNTWIE